MIEIRHLAKSYGRLQALRDLSLAIGRGEIVALLGANGAGKSTLIRCLLGLTGYCGTISVAGLDPLRQGKAVRRLIGYMPQDGGLHPDLTVARTVAFYAALRQVPEARGLALCAELGLGELAEFEVGELSGGLRQRLGFALALLSDPPILLLDEPTASLDRGSRELLVTRLEALGQAGKTILLSTHAERDLLTFPHRAIFLEEGRLVGDQLRPPAPWTGAFSVGFELEAAP